MDRFNAWLLKQRGVPATFESVRLDELPVGDVELEVRYSSLNYKDALSLCAKAPIARKFPMVPGIDLAGIVVKSESEAWKTGDQAVLTGWGLGESHWVGLSERARVSSDWLLLPPHGLDLRSSMALGTAGLTAMLCVIALEVRGIGKGASVVVTGAGGGVGSIAVALLAKQGLEVTAVSGRPELASWLRDLGATHVIGRQEVLETKLPLGTQRWDGAVDTVGSSILASVLASLRYRGCAAICGLAAGSELSTTVLPFILRNISLAGIDSVQCPSLIRIRAWERLAKTEIDLEALSQEVKLDEAYGFASRLLQGQVRGRIVLKP